MAFNAAKSEDYMMGGEDSILEVKEISFSYPGAGKGKQIFSDITFRLKRGDVFILLGANGAGKSTLLNCLSNMLTPDTGEVLLNGKRFSQLGIRETAKIMGYVPQLYAPSFSYTVRDYVVMGCAPHMGILSVPQHMEYEKADAALCRMKMEHLADKVYTQISGGERQQVQIARVLVQESKIILLDEPTNHLDYGNQLKILQTISDLAQEGITIVMTTHNPDHAILLDGTVGILDNRGHLNVGSAREVISEESLKELYQTSLHLIYIDKVGRMACIPGNLKNLT
ncbi:ABC transporter ATP-binding protein [Lachnospiraceae bacterium ZAX-1]